MVIWNIAVKNMKTFLASKIILPMLIGMPVFQILIMKMIFHHIEVSNRSIQEELVKVIILQPTMNGSFIQHFAANVLVMFILITGITAAAMIIGEREDNTLMRTFAAPVTKFQVIAGNVLGHSLIMLLVAAIIIVITKSTMGIEWGSSPIGMFWITIFVIYVSISMGLVFSGIFRNSKVATGVMSFFIIVMTFASGGMTPTGGFGNFSRFTINKWAFDAYIKLMEGKMVPSILNNLLVLGIIGTIFALAAIMIYRRENIYE